MLPQLAHVLAQYDKMGLNHQEIPPFRNELASTTLAASRFSDMSWKIEMITRAKQLLKDSPDSYLNAWLTYRESAILRMRGKRDESAKTLEDFVRATALPANNRGSELTPRYNAQRSDLIISFSENMIQQGRLEEAKMELYEWSPLDLTAPSTLERIASRARDITLGKILRYQGLFKDALVLLEKVLEESHIDDFFEGTGWYRVLLSGVADLYIELDRPEDAEKILRQELQPMVEAGTQDIATGKRLRLSLVETYLERNMFGIAEEALLHLKEEYEVIKEPDYATSINIFRVWLGLARVSHRQGNWEDALSYWRQALAATEQLKMSNGFNAGIVRYSLAHALLMTGDSAQSDLMVAQAKQNMASEPRMFWIAGFNSKWHDYAIISLGHGTAER